MELREALTISQSITLGEADDLIKEMVEELEEGRDPEEILSDYGLKPDYVFDLINIIS